MKHMYLKWLSLLLTLCMLFSLASCQQPPVDEPGDQNPPEELPPEDGTTPEAPTEFVLTAEYALVRPEERTEEEVEALQLLGRGLESAYGFRFSKGTDLAERKTFEILIGNTNREESKAAFKELAYHDWTYQIVSANTVVICGGSPAATLKATRAFLRDVIGYEEKEGTKEVLSAGQAATLKVDKPVFERYEYPITSFKFAGRDLSEYTLVTYDTKAEANSMITDYLFAMTGVQLPVVAYHKFKGGPAIFFGCANETGGHLPYPAFGEQRYFIVRSGDNIVIDFIRKANATTAAERFIKECTPEEGVKTMDLTFSTEPVITGLYIEKGTNNLELVSVDKTEIAPGVIYEEHLYHDGNGKPVRAYIITIEKGAATISVSTPGDKAETGKLATVLSQAKAAEANGKKVVAAINADFFVGGTMEGLCIKDGKLLHDHCGRPWFAITKDGKPVVGTGKEVDKYQGELMTAVGGSNIVLLYDSVSHVSVGTDWGDTRHPRSAVGFKPDGSIVLMVVDGRMPEVSNGASLSDLAFILGGLGCSEGFNLDGGGSSTFVLKNEEGEFEVKNTPSDGSLRPVADGLMVILP